MSILPLLGPLLGVMVGYLLSQHATRTVESKGNIKKFKDDLASYLDGNCTSMQMRISYTSLPNKIKN
jgi:hypothetical protein